jgi:tellurite resistance-related uncharacterized protein
MSDARKRRKNIQKFLDKNFTKEQQQKMMEGDFSFREMTDEQKEVLQEFIFYLNSKQQPYVNPKGLMDNL